ncbi:MAG: hypothetical protein ABIO36_04390 [Pyrinomonadaceae bacterium]
MRCRIYHKMTTKEMLFVTCLYLIAFIAVIYFTRATSRRVAGSVAGGLAASMFGLGAIALCEALGWWHIPFAPTVFFLPVFYVGLAITLAPIYLITWRLTRRFGLRGLVIFVGIVAAIGPPRDYGYATMFPEWMVFGPGVAPILADSATYVGAVVIGHAVMRLVSGASGDDRLAR